MDMDKNNDNDSLSSDEEGSERFDRFRREAFDNQPNEVSNYGVPPNADDNHPILHDVDNNSRNIPGRDLIGPPATVESPSGGAGYGYGGAAPSAAATAASAAASAAGAAGSGYGAGYGSGYRAGGAGAASAVAAAAAAAAAVGPGSGAAGAGSGAGACSAAAGGMFVTAAELVANLNRRTSSRSRSANIIIPTRFREIINDLPNPVLDVDRLASLFNHTRNRSNVQLIITRTYTTNIEGLRQQLNDILIKYNQKPINVAQENKDFVKFIEQFKEKF